MGVTLLFTGLHHNIQKEEIYINHSCHILNGERLKTIIRFVREFIRMGNTSNGC